jgi:hypothetical protein
MLDFFSPVITADDTLNLCSIPFESEVIRALSSLGSSKALGLDGFTALFYKKYWSSIRKDVLACVGNFFQNRHLLNEPNHTYITLVPKQSGSHTIHHFRPISLCNITYKIISKILANRLKIVLPKIISPFQELLCLVGTFKTTQSLLMNSFILSRTRKVKEVSCFSK